jgi:hypothetical protein
MVAKLSSTSTMSAASRATSVPDCPMATPMSARLRAGASFTPSPVAATTSPIARRAVTIRSLCSGVVRENRTCPSDSWLRSSSSGMASSYPPSMTATSGLIDDADLAGDRLGGEPVVAGDHHDPDAGRPAPLDGGHHLLTGRVQRGGQAGEDQLLLDRPRADGVDLGLEVGGQVVVGMPRTRSPARAMRSFSSITWSRSAWVRGTSRPFTSAWV